MDQQGEILIDTFAFVEAKLRASAKQMFSHVDARYVSQTTPRWSKAESRWTICMALIAYEVFGKDRF